MLGIERKYSKDCNDILFSSTELLLIDPPHFYIANKYEEDEENELCLKDKTFYLEQINEQYDGGLETDPVKPYGPGVISYFYLFRSLMKVFIVMSIFAICMIIIYRCMNGADYMLSLIHI